MTTNTVALLVAFALSGSMPAGRQHAHTVQDKKTDQKAAPGIAGRWTMSVKGGPHGDATMGLALEQKGRQVSGTFATPHGDDLQIQVSSRREPSPSPRRAAETTRSRSRRS